MLGRVWPQQVQAIPVGDHPVPAAGEGQLRLPDHGLRQVLVLPVPRRAHQPSCGGHLTPHLPNGASSQVLGGVFILLFPIIHLP